MSDSNQNNDAYVFVDASTKEADNSYSVKPAHPYVFPAWEWLLERTLRRSLILEYFDKDAALAVLATRMKNYRMHRWPSYGVSSYYWSCTAFPDADLRFRYTNHCHDGSLAASYPNLTINGNKRSGKFRVNTDEDTRSSVASLAVLVDRLLDNTQFLAPDWAPPSGEGNGFRIESSLVETTAGQCDETGSWSWTTNIVNFSPFELPESPFFRLLTDTRVDEPAVTVTIEDSDGNTRRVKLAKTMPAYTEDDLRTYHGVKVLAAGYQGVNTLESLAFRTQTDMTGTSGSLEGDGPYASATGRTDVETVAVTIPGPIKRKQGSAVYVDIYASNDAIGFVQPDVDWGGELHEPTWWHANGFPKGLDSVTSGKMKRQLKALSVTQPAIPPVILNTNEFPENGYDCFDGVWTAVRWHHIGNSWPGNTVAIAATPHCISKMLDALKKTVFEVPAVFFKIKCSAEETLDEKSYKKVETGDDDPTDPGEMDFDNPTSWYKREETYEVNGTATSANLLTADVEAVSDLAYRGDDISEDYNDEYYEFYTNTSTVYGQTTKYWKRTRETVKSTFEGTTSTTLKNLAILRSTSATTTDYTYKHYTKKNGSSYSKPNETTIENGDLPDSYEPADSDLMFPAWIRKWIAEAELFMSYEVVLEQSTPYKRSYTTTLDRQTPNYRTVYSDSSGSGSRATKAAKGVLSLGKMNLSTGKFPDIDLVELRGRCVPPGGGRHSPSGGTDMHSTHDSKVKITETRLSNSDTGERIDVDVGEYTDEYPPRARYHRSSKLFVVVEWKFDNESPEPFGEQLAERAALLAAMKASDAAKLALLAAQDAVRHAENEVVARNKALEAAQEALGRADETRPAEQDYAEREVELAREEVEKATQRLADANAALEEAIRTETGIEAAQAMVDDATDSLNEANGALAEAQEYLRRVVEEYREMLQEAVDEAQSRLDDANTALQEAEDAVAEKEQAVAEADQTATEKTEDYSSALENYAGPLR